jgi:hypothetical protein
LLSAAEHVEAAAGGNRISPQAEIVRQRSGGSSFVPMVKHRDSLRKPKPLSAVKDVMMLLQAQNNGNRCSGWDEVGLRTKPNGGSTLFFLVW